MYAYGGPLKGLLHLPATQPATGGPCRVSDSGDMAGFAAPDKRK